MGQDLYVPDDKKRRPRRAKHTEDSMPRTSETGTLKSATEESMRAGRVNMHDTALNANIDIWRNANAAGKGKGFTKYQR